MRVARSVPSCVREIKGSRHARSTIRAKWGARLVAARSPPLETPRKGRLLDRQGVASVRSWVIQAATLGKALER